jgi:hypothetical protein
MTAGFSAEVSERYEAPTGAILGLLRRHAFGDWGDVCDEDSQANADAIRLGNRIVSVYHLRLTAEERKAGRPKGPKVYAITEWDRSLTTLMLAEEY